MNRVAALGLSLCFVMTSRATEQPANPVATRTALAALFASSNAAIPRTSSCYGEYGQKGRPRIRDMMAMSMAYLHTGTNTIQGECATSRCSINITHAAGEDVASYTIQFRLLYGNADPTTLQCQITP